MEETAIARAYYYYLCVIADPNQRPELRAYIKTYFPRLHGWMNRHRRCMEEYRRSGDWDPSRVTGES